MIPGRLILDSICLVWRRAVCFKKVYAWYDVTTLHLPKEYAWANFRKLRFKHVCTNAAGPLQKGDLGKTYKFISEPLVGTCVCVVHIGLSVKE